METPRTPDRKHVWQEYLKDSEARKKALREQNKRLGPIIFPLRADYNTKVTFRAPDNGNF